MKRPYLNMEQRREIRRDTFVGSALKLGLANDQLLKTIRKNEGCIGAWIAKRELNKAYKTLTINQTIKR